MIYLRIFEDFEDKRSFQELDPDDIFISLLDDIDKKKIELEIFKETDKLLIKRVVRNCKTINLYNRDNINPDTEFIRIIFKLAHPYMVRNSSFDYENYTKQLLIEKLKRFYKNYNINIFLTISSINLMENKFCEGFIIIQERGNDIKYNQPLKVGEKAHIVENNSFIEDITDIIELNMKDDSISIEEFENYPYCANISFDLLTKNKIGISHRNNSKFQIVYGHITNADILSANVRSIVNTVSTFLVTEDFQSKEKICEIVKEKYRRIINLYPNILIYSDTPKLYTFPCYYNILFILNPLKNITEKKSENIEVEEIEDYFLELIDHKYDKIPIKVEVLKHTINKKFRNYKQSRKEIDGFKIYIIYDIYDHVYIDKFVQKTINRLEKSYNIHYNQVSKSGNGYTEKEIPVHGRDRTSTILDPKWKRTITISPKLISENNTVESNLIIVDVQKSFRKFYTEMYLNKLNKYANTFTNVYQIFDNHVDGKNVDNDYLYDDNPDIPVNGDLYKFPNQKSLVEKRYQYDVNVDFYKKILDVETFNMIKKKELKGQLVKGELFNTTQGTVIIYIGNNHNWIHLGKKIINLLQSLKGKYVTIVGGADNECLEDIYVSAESFGVLIKRDHRYIYSASNCPIK